MSRAFALRNEEVVAPHSVSSEGGAARRWGEAPAAMKAIGAATGERITIVDATERPGLQEGADVADLPALGAGYGCELLHA